MCGILSFLKVRTGFLGPIGDDLPSLIPIIFSLVIFFSTFTYSFNVFNSRNIAFAQDMDVLRLSSIMKADGYIVDYNDFSNSCNNVKKTNFSFYYIIFVTDDVTNPSRSGLINLEGDINIFCLSDGCLVCNSSNISITNNPINNILSGIGVHNRKKFLVKVFPIVVEDNKIAKPMHLVVLIWD